VENLMKRPTESQEASRASTGCTDERFAKQYPTLLEYMTTESWEDGGKREPSSLSVRIEGGEFLVSLNDKANKASVYTTAGSIQEALKLMEGALVSGKAPWRVWKGKK
jgi:hypothetical protein